MTHILYDPQLLDKLTQNYPDAFELLKQEADDTMQQVLTAMQQAGLEQSDLPLIEAVLRAYPEYKEDLPFADQDATYALRLQSNHGLSLIQKYFDFWH